MRRLIPDEEHARVLQTGIDVPAQHPQIAIPLSEVGISGKTVWVKTAMGRFPFTAAIMISLGAGSRGIHMSRLEEAITLLTDRPFEDIRAYGLALGNEILASHPDQEESTRVAISLTGQLPYQRQAPVSGKISTDSLNVSANIHLNGADHSREIYLGVGVHHITACPCTMEYNRELFQSDDRRCPLPTHSQRSLTWLKVEASDQHPSIDELRGILEKSLHVSQDLLKRPDEAELVLKSHLKPQFAEDAVRETAKNAADLLVGMLPLSSRLEIESTSLESIHIHDVKCRLQATLARITAHLSS